jgi:hypothetical protein
MLLDVNRKVSLNLGSFTLRLLNAPRLLAEGAAFTGFAGTGVLRMCQR